MPRYQLPPEHKDSKQLVIFHQDKSKVYIYLNKDNVTRYDFTKICLKEKFNIARLCERLNVTDYAIRQAFKKCFGIAPKVWMRQTRVRLGIQLFREGIRADHVCNLLGYHDYSHMMKEFKECAGESPSLTRKRILSQQVSWVG